MNEEKINPKQVRGTVCACMCVCGGGGGVGEGRGGGYIVFPVNNG